MQNAGKVWLRSSTGGIEKLDRLEFPESLIRTILSLVSPPASLHTSTFTKVVFQLRNPKLLAIEQQTRTIAVMGFANFGLPIKQQNDSFDGAFEASSNRLPVMQVHSSEDVSVFDLRALSLLFIRR